MILILSLQLLRHEGWGEVDMAATVEQGHGSCCHTRAHGCSPRPPPVHMVVPPWEDPAKRIA